MTKCNHSWRHADQESEGDRWFDPFTVTYQCVKCGEEYKLRVDTRELWDKAAEEVLEGYADVEMV